MAQTLLQQESMPVVLHVPTTLEMTQDQFFEFCQANRDFRIERTAEGDLLIMPPAGGETSHRNAGLTAVFYVWARRDGSGLVFDSSGGFQLPNGATRAPDVAWVRRSRWDALTAKERRGFAPLCPEFVLELRSPSDDLSKLQEKMEEYVANGARLGWLIDPVSRRVHVYRGDGRVEILEDPSSVSGDPTLPGFVLELSDIWG